MPSELDYSGLTDDELKAELVSLCLEKKVYLRKIDEVESLMVGIREEQFKRKNRSPEVSFYDLDDE